jgi:hypothetical protein
MALQRANNAVERQVPFQERCDGDSIESRRVYGRNTIMSLSMNSSGIWRGAGASFNSRL